MEIHYTQAGGITGHTYVLCPPVLYSFTSPFHPPREVFLFGNENSANIQDAIDHVLDVHYGPLDRQETVL